MPGIDASAYNTNKKTTTAVNQLTDLLDLFYPDPSPNIFTLHDFRTRYKLTGLGELATREIEQSQRINQRIHDFSQMGLCEFHIGLIYLFWGDFRGATLQFRLARRQWTFIKKPKHVLCLAYFAEGVAQELAYHYEDALSCYGRARQCLERNTAAEFGFPNSAHSKTVQTITQQLNQRSSAVRNILWNNVRQTWQPYPIAAEYQSECVWYQVQSAQKDFLPQIKEGMWLLVNQQSKDFKNYPLVAAGHDEAIAGGISLHAAAGSPATFRRIYLATPRIEEAGFARNETIELLFTRYSKITLEPNQILGVVVGFWHNVEAPM